MSCVMTWKGMFMLLSPRVSLSSCFHMWKGNLRELTKAKTVYTCFWIQVECFRGYLLSKRTRCKLVALLMWNKRKTPEVLNSACLCTKEIIFETSLKERRGKENLHNKQNQTSNKKKPCRTLSAKWVVSFEFIFLRRLLSSLEWFRSLFH